MDFQLQGIGKEDLARTSHSTKHKVQPSQPTKHKKRGKRVGQNMTNAKHIKRALEFLALSKKLYVNQKKEHDGEDEDIQINIEQAIKHLLEIRKR